MKNLQLFPHRQQTIDQAAFAFTPLLLALIKTKRSTLHTDFGCLVVQYQNITEIHAPRGVHIQ